MVAVSNRDDEVATDEHHDLARLDDLPGQRHRFVWHVVHRLEHHEQGVVVALGLGPLVGVHRILDRQRMQSEKIGDGLHLIVVRFVQADPDERLLSGVLEFANPRECRYGGEGAGKPCAVRIDRTIDDGSGDRYRYSLRVDVMVGIAPEDQKRVHRGPRPKRRHACPPSPRRSMVGMLRAGSGPGGRL